MLREGMIDRVYIVSPGSLRQGWLEEYCEVCGEESDYLLNYYTFITYNYNVERYLPTNFNKSLVVIDEIHNLINSVKNKSKNAVAIYNKIMNSDCRVLALSGTPIFANIWEWPYLGNLLKPGAFPSKEEFETLYNVNDNGILTLRDKNQFLESIKGIISYFPGAGTELYPEVIHEKPIESIMTELQDESYQRNKRSEDIILARGYPKPPRNFRDARTRAKYEEKKRKYLMSKKRILSRRPSNFYYPDEAYDENWHKKQDAVFPAGWVRKEYFKNNLLQKEYSTKMSDLIANIIRHWDSKHVVFSFFKESSGVNIIKAMLEMCNLGANYASFTGDRTDKQREKMLKKFNDKSNRYGEDIKILFVTDAGAEGITLKEVGHLHILESDVRENKTQQVIGRVVRYKSHIDMPRHERNVHIWRYWSIGRKISEFPITLEYISVKPDGEIVTETEETYFYPAIDQILYIEGLKKMNTINSFLGILSEGSIEMHKEV
jgi:superfamily II DNA or RNA helicase